MRAKTLLIIPLLLVVASCAPKSITSVEGNVAFHAKNVLDVVEEAQKALISLTEQGAVEKEAAVEVMKSFKEVGQAGQQLTGVLRAIDSLTAGAERDAKLAEVREILLKISSLLQSSLVPIGNQEARAQIAGLITQVNQTLLTISMELAQTTAQ